MKLDFELSEEDAALREYCIALQRHIDAILARPEQPAELAVDNGDNTLNRELQ